MKGAPASRTTRALWNRASILLQPRRRQRAPSVYAAASLPTRWSGSARCAWRRRLPSPIRAGATATTTSRSSASRRPGTPSSNRSGPTGLPRKAAPSLRALRRRDAQQPDEVSGRSDVATEAPLAGATGLPVDVDWLADDARRSQSCGVLSTHDALIYTTDSSTMASPRCRYILRLSRPVKYDEAIIVGEQLQRDIVAAIGVGRIKFDSSVLRGEQPNYLPTVRAERFDTHGAALDVDAMLARATAVQAESHAAPKPKKATSSDTKPGTSGTQVRADAIAEADPVFRRLDERRMVKSQAGPGIFNVECPCGAEHTTESTETSCQYRLPNFAGVRYGKFICQHAHCHDREQREFLEALDLNPTEVWAEQRGEVRADPLDDFTTSLQATMGWRRR